MGLGVSNGNNKVSILLYADDIAIVSENEINLQLMLNRLYEWCQSWFLTINTDKSQIVHFRKKRKKRSDFSFSVGPTQLKIVDQYKYLGITLNENLDYKVCAQELADAGGRALGSLITKFKPYKGIGYSTFTKLYEQGVIPITDYCSSVWGFSNPSFAEKIQNRACRYFLGVHSKTPLHVLQGDVGWLKPKYRIYLNILKYYNRLIKMDHDRLTYRIFEHDLQNITNDSWCGELEKILDQTGMLGNLIDGNEIDIDVAREKLFTLYDLEWQDSISTKPKLRTYVKFKCHISTENYVSQNINKYERSLLAKLRSGTLPLAVETGRFKCKQLCKRLCELCNSNEIEDEEHFIVTCPFYKTQRISFFNYISCNVSEDFDNLNPEPKSMIAK